MNDTPIVIVGAGPAGLTAAMQLTRMGMPVQLFEAHRAGGLLNQAYRVDNYPGQCEGICGSELAARLARHAERVGVTIRLQRVTQIAAIENAFAVSVADETIVAKTVILATGTAPIPWHTDAIAPTARDRVHADVNELRHCSDRQIVIVGAGDAAYDYALTLASRNSVTLLRRSDAPRAHRLLQNEVAMQKTIAIRASTQLQRVDSDNTAATPGLTLRIANAGQTESLAADHVLLAIGREPNLSMLEPSLNARVATLANDEGKPKTGVKCIENGSATLYSIGDVVNGRCRQTACAVGDAMAAAMTIVSRRRTC